MMGLSLRGEVESENCIVQLCPHAGGTELRTHRTSEVRNMKESLRPRPKHRAEHILYAPLQCPLGFVCYMNFDSSAKGTEGLDCSSVWEFTLHLGLASRPVARGSSLLYRTNIKLR